MSGGAGITERQPRVRAWRAEIAAARKTCALFRTGKTSLDDLARVAPLLIDSAYSSHCEPILDGLADSDFDERPRLAMAKGRLCFLRGDSIGATALVSRALSRAAGDPPLLARAVWELGCLALRDDNVSTAEVTLQLGRGTLGAAAERTPDLLHLEALMAERRFDRGSAIQKYREAIAAANEALTLLTRVIALRNLAGALAHDRPRDASALCALALALIDGDLLDERSRPAIENVLAYTLLAGGLIENGRLRAEAAGAEARRQGHGLIEAYALFNQAIALELSGRLPDAEARLTEGLELSTDGGFSDIARWIKLRLAWLHLKAGNPVALEENIERSFADGDGDAYAASVSTYRAIVAYRTNDAPHAIEALEPLVDHYTALSDWATTFALLLWLACAHTKAGDRGTAIAAVEAALRIGQTHGLRLSPSWWSDDLVAIARELALPQDFAYTETLVGETGSIHEAIATRVTVSGDGDILIDGTKLAEDQWRTGRSGQWMLRRLFQCLAAAHPIGIHRDEIADLLWPASDGDRARQNLFAALNDLRRLLHAVPGLSIATEDGRYRLIAPATVHFDRAPRSD